MNTRYKIQANPLCQRILSCLLVFLFVLFGVFNEAQAVAGVPKILNHQGRLLDANGNLLGGSGTDFCFKFALYDDATVGSPDNQLWPSGATSTMTINVKNGIFNTGIGDTSVGGDTLDYNFQDNDTVYLGFDVASKVGDTCAPGDGVEVFERLNPRQRITASGYAVNADTVDGFHASQSPTGNQIPVLSGGSLTLTGGITMTNATTTNATSTNLAVTESASTSNLIVSNNFTFKNVTGFLKAVAGAVATALIDLANDVTGILGVENGGTGWANIYSNSILLGNGTTKIATTSNTGVSAGYVLMYTSEAPQWVSTTTQGWLTLGSLSATYPVIDTAGVFSLAFGTTTSNTWGGTQTFSSAPTFSSLIGGGLAVDATGVVYKGATTTAGTGLTYSGNAFNINTSQNISTLSNLTNNGVVYTVGGTGDLQSVATTSLTASSPLNFSQPISVIGSLASSLTLNDAGVTYAKIQNLNYGEIIGRNIASAGVSTGLSTSTYKSMLALISSDVGLSNVSNSAQVTAVTGTYPVISSGGLTPAISLAFGTTTSNTWAGTQTFNNQITGSISGSAGSVANSVTFNNSGSGAVSGSTFNGGSAITVSYNTIGAQVAGSYLTSAITTLGDAYHTGLSGATQTFATSSPDTNLGMTIISSGTQHLFTPYWIGTLANNRLTNSSLTVTAGSGLIGGGSVALGSSVTLSAQISTSSVPTAGNLAYWTGAGTPSTIGTVATGTVSSSGGITVTASQSIIGSGLTVGCTTADASNAGCLSAANWTTFNNKWDLASSTIPVNKGGTGLTSATAGYFLVGLNTTLQATSTIFINPTGNVGIGTTTPLTKLSVYGGNTTFQTSSNSATAFQILNAATSSVFTIDTIAGRLTATYASTTAISTSYASSTLGYFGSLNIPSLTSTGLGVNSSGQIYGAATTTFNNGITYSNGSAGLSSIAANTLLGNNTGASAVPTAIATSSLGIALSNTTGTLAVDRGGTASTTPLGGILVGNGSSYVKSLTVGTNLTFDGTTLSASGGSGYATIKDETTPLTARTTLAFLGAGVTCVDSGGVQTDCTIPGGAAGGVSLAPAGADADTSSNPSIWINDTAGGNLLQLQTGGLDKFVVANSGGLTINGADNSETRTTTADFTTPFATEVTNLTNTNDKLELSDGTVSGDGTVTTANQPPVDGNVGAGASSILQADGKYLLLKGGGTGTSVYDSLASNFTASTALTNAVGAGSVVLPRPNGMFVVVSGGGALTSTNLDPMMVVAPSNGPALTTITANTGTVAFRRNDGRFIMTTLTTNGSTAIYDPILNTFVAGPINSGSVVWGAGSLVLPRSNGNALFVTGGAAATTQAYTGSTGTITGSGPIGTFAVGPVLPTGCEINNAGSSAIRKPDGKYIVMSKINVSAVYDPVANTWSQNAGSCTTPTSGRGPTVALADGAHAIPLQDGRFLIIHGGSLTSTSIYDPQTDLFTSGPTITAGGAGRHTIVATDGTWRLIAGGAGTATDKYSTQLIMTGIYRSDDIYNTNLNGNSTLRWTRESESQFSGIGQGSGGPGIFTAAQSAGGGSCTAGLHSYRVTFMINGVETHTGPASNQVTCVGGTDKVNLTNIPIGPVGTTARKVYRVGTASTFTSYKLVGSGTCVLNDNTTATCTDTLADASLGVVLPLTTQSGAGAASTVQFFVRTAAYSGGTCTTPLNNALDKEITTQADFIRPASGDNCIRVTAKFNRPLPKRIVDERERGTYYGNNNTVFRIEYATPTVFDITVDNSSVLRRSGVTFNFPLPNSEFNSPGGGSGSYVPVALTAGAPSSGGSCTAGTHTWKYTYITGGQESLPSPVSAMQTCTGGNGTVVLTGVTVGPAGTTARKIYRTFANDTSQYFLLTTINDNTTTSYNDVSADSALTSVIPGLEPSGPTFSRVESTENQLYLPNGRITPTSQGATTALGYYLGGPTATAPWSAAHPSLPQAQTNTGTIVITRPNKTFKIIAALTTPAANASIYDPASEQFSALQSAPNIPTAANGAGGFAVKRPDGKFLVVLGNASSVTNIYDPVNDTFVLGPAIPAGVVANGGQAIPNADGTFTILQGNTTVNGTTESVTTAVYDPVRNTMTAGPTIPGTGVGSGTWAILLKNGMWKVSHSGDCATAGLLTTMSYDPRTKVFIEGPSLVTTLAGCGLIFERADGFWQMFTGESAALGTLTTNLINPNNGGSGIGTPLITNLAGEGTLMIPRPDGTFWLLMGNGLATTNIIIPFGRLPAAATLAGSPDLGEMPIGPVLSTVIGPGAIAFQRPDGKYVLINGNAAATTQLLDVGWYADGQYQSEMMQVPPLPANSTLEWKQGPDNYVKMEVRVAASQAALQRAPFVAVGRPGQSIYNAGGETWVQVEVNMRREFPTWTGALDGVYKSGGGMVFPYRKIPQPTVYSYQINNGIDLLNLKVNGLEVFRVTSNGGIFSSANGGFFAGGADLAENYTSTEMLEPGEVVVIDPSTPQGVMQSTRPYDKNILGVVSTNPGLVTGAYTEDSFPIALIGRVPVKISTENGNIQAGDYLTSASIPGYAMKATFAGRVIGKALESLDTSILTACPGDSDTAKRKCGTISVFVNLIDYGGESVDVLMSQWKLDKALSVVVENATSTESSLGEAADGLVFENSEPLPETASTAASTTAAIASATTEAIVTSSIVAVPLSHQEDVLVFLQALKIERLETLAPTSEILTDRLSAVSEIFSPNIFAGSLEVTNVALFRGGLTVNSIGSAGDILSILSDTIFIGRPYFTTDTAGFALIKKGDTSVAVTFEREYLEQPIVSASISFEAASSTTAASSPLAAAEGQEQSVFDNDISFLIMQKSTTDFTIILNKPAPVDIPFSWIALAVKGAKTFVSDEDDNPAPSQTIPEETPPSVTPSVEISDEESPPPIEEPETIEASPSVTPSVEISDEESPPPIEEPETIEASTPLNPPAEEQAAGQISIEPVAESQPELVPEASESPPAETQPLEVEGINN